jgi:hypothetical protein
MPHGIPSDSYGSWAANSFINSKDAPCPPPDPGRTFSFPNPLFFAHPNRVARLPVTLRFPIMGNATFLSFPGFTKRTRSLSPYKENILYD